MAIRFEILGPLTATNDGQRVKLGGAKQQSVLASLLLWAGEVVPDGVLVEAVWGEEYSEGIRKTLQVYISSLRKLAPTAADGTLIERHGSGYRIDVDRCEIDLLDVQASRSRAQQLLGDGDTAAACRELEAALGHFHGDPLAGLELGVVAEPRLARIDEMHQSLWETYSTVVVSTGARGAVDRLFEPVDRWPFSEQLRGNLMLALHAAGRQADALAVYSDGRRLLVDELGLEPSPALRELERQILLGESVGPAIPGAAAGRAEDLAESTVLRSSVIVPEAFIEVDGNLSALTQPTTRLGRSDDCDVVIPDVYASRVHAEIRAVGLEFDVVDLGSANGTRVNGERIERHRLTHGDVILIGDTPVTFEVPT